VAAGLDGRITYVLPIRSERQHDGELSSYLAEVAAWCDVVVVDGSPPAVHDEVHERWSSYGGGGGRLRHVRPDPVHACANGKVRGVLTGLDLVTTPALVIADDDVRWEREALERALVLLAHADVVRPQNHFDPLPWHARWDTARTLLNRATGGDFPGTLVVRTATLRATGGYDGDVLFENLELIRTVRAAGGRVATPLDLHVRRLPPTTRHFLGQRVRQAYDELARPVRLGVWASVVPAGLLAAATRRWRPAAAVVAAIVGLAEVGRRRAGAREVFPASASLLAPAWVLERGVCTWLALASRARGGVRYGDGRLRRAATPPRVLRRRLRAAAGRQGPPAAGQSAPDSWPASSTPSGRSPEGHSPDPAMLSLPTFVC